MKLDGCSVKFMPKSEMRSMRFLALFLGESFMTRFWTAHRIPFSKSAVISYPEGVLDPLSPKYNSVVEHEMIHVKDMASAWGLFKMFWLVWLLPLPILFSGRWFIERHAYLHNILKHGYNIDRVVDSLWSNYGFCWPKSLMRKWFWKQIEKNKE